MDYVVREFFGYFFNVCDSYIVQLAFYTQKYILDICPN